MLTDQLTPQFLRRLELLRLRSRRSFLGSRQGGHISKKRGFGMEFSDYRRYELGDNPRHIDWGVYGRSDRLYIKQFQEEQELSILILIDTSASVFTSTDNAKWRFVRDLALSITYVALMQQDTVVLALSDGRLSPKLSGARAIHQASSFLLQAKGHPGAELAEKFRRALAAVRFPGVCIVISDFLCDEREVSLLIKGILAKNFDASFMQVLSSEDTSPPLSGDVAVAVDSENGAELAMTLDATTLTQYQYLLQQHSQMVRNLCVSNNIRFLSTESSRPLADFIIKDLPGSGLLTQ